MQAPPQSVTQQASQLEEVVGRLRAEVEGLKQELATQSAEHQVELARLSEAAAVQEEEAVQAVERAVYCERLRWV